MLAVTIISVTLSSIIALASIAASVWRDRQRQIHERGIADRASVGDLLSRTAAVLHKAEYAIDDALSSLLAYGAAMFDTDHPNRMAPYDKLEEVGQEFDEVLGQVRIRLGPEHPATKSLEEADVAFLDSFRAMGMIHMEDPAIKGTYAEQEVRDFVRRERDRANRGRDNFKIAQEQFVVRAHAAAGVHLPVSETNSPAE
jgi:hypothetical protein